MLVASMLVMTLLSVSALAVDPMPLSPPSQPDQATRIAEVQSYSTQLRAQVVARKLTHLKAAQLYLQRFTALFPEQSSNPLAQELFAYQAVVAEKIDQKKLTETEAQYEIARKVSELQERQARLRADAAATQSAESRRAADETQVRLTSEEAVAAAKRAAEAAEQQRLAEQRRQWDQLQQDNHRAQLQREQLESRQRVQEDERRQLLDQQRQANFQNFMRLLTTPRPSPPPMRMTTCTNTGDMTVCTGN
jgi:hypothetical protein